MERIVKEIKHRDESKKLLRVAAYARVSSAKDEMLHSLSAQISYYNNLILNNPEWLFCGVFSDESKTGTKSDRKAFVTLINLCRQGKINLIITKSVSRFARNTVDLLETIRELKTLNVDVFFEEQNIHTMSAEGELMLTFLAGYAQEESLSASENQKWKIRHGFESGTPTPVIMLGYKLNGDSLEIIPDEAETVKMIFSEYLSGLGQQRIANKLNELNIKTKLGKTWTHSAVRRILTNEKYCGDLMLQKFYNENHLTKHKMINDGVLPKYFVENAHEPIIDKETYEKAQEILKKNQKYLPKKASVMYPFSHMLICGACDCYYRRKTTVTGIVWICPTYNKKGKKYCPTAKQIPETTLIETCCNVLGIDEFDETIFKDNIENIIVTQPNELLFRFHNRSEQSTHWQDRSRSESWTPEKRIDASRRSKWRRR